MTVNRDGRADQLRSGVAHCSKGQTDASRRETIREFVLRKGAEGVKASQLARCLSLPLRTVQYHLNHLAASHGVVKVGQTNGVMYFPPEAIPRRHAKVGIHRILLQSRLLQDGEVGRAILQDVLDHVKGKAFRRPSMASRSGYEWDQAQKWARIEEKSGEVWYRGVGRFSRWRYAIKVHPSTGEVDVETSSSRDPLSPSDLHNFIGYLRAVFPWIEMDAWVLDHPEINIDITGVGSVTIAAQSKVHFKDLDLLLQTYVKGKDWLRKEARLPGKTVALWLARMMLMEQAAINGTGKLMEWPWDEEAPKNGNEGYS